jgi:hypothetical protein
LDQVVNRLPPSIMAALSALPGFFGEPPAPQPVPLTLEQKVELLWGVHPELHEAHA